MEKALRDKREKPAVGSYSAMEIKSARDRLVLQCRNQVRRARLALHYTISDFITLHNVFNDTYPVLVD